MRRSLLELSLLITSALAQDSTQPKVSDDWVEPRWPDGTTVLTSGQLYELRWTANLTRWFPGYAPSANVANVTLWITGAFQQQYSRVVAPFIDLTQQLGTQWTVNLPEDELEATEDWTFRFLASNVTTFGGAIGEQVSSPQVRIRANSTTPTSPVRTAPPTPSTATPSSSSSTVPLAAPASDSGLSPGATAGIAIGTASIALLLAFALWWYLRRRNIARKKNEMSQLNPPMTEPSAYQDNVATNYNHGHVVTASQSSNGDYFSTYGVNSHTGHSGTFSGSTLSSFPGGASPPPPGGQLPAYPVTPRSGSNHGMMTPGSEGAGTIGNGGTWYEPAPTAEKVGLEGGEMDVPAGTVVTPSEVVGSEVERSELEAPHRGLHRDQGAETRRD